MTDNWDFQSSEDIFEKDRATDHLPHSSVELHFPQLLSEASLQSLLTHSITSNTITSRDTIINMKQPVIPIDGSFIHVDDTDTDDDARSEATDISLTHPLNFDNVPTAVSGEESSDAESDNVMDNITFARDDYKMLDLECESHGPPSTSVRDDAKAVPNTNVGLVHPRNGGCLPSPVQENLAGYVLDQTPNITLGVNGDKGGFRHRPLRVLSISQSATSSSKDEALRKIGSVWIRPSLLSRSSSTHYQIVPSEFTMDFQSKSSDLIEIPAQMIVYEGCLSAENACKPNHSHPWLTLTDGTRVEFNKREKINIEDVDGKWYIPDLVLVLTSKSDGSEFHKCLDAFISTIVGHTNPLVVQEDTGSTCGYAITDLETLCNLDPKSVNLFIQDFLDTGTGDLGISQVDNSKPVSRVGFPRTFAAHEDDMTKMKMGLRAMDIQSCPVSPTATTTFKFKNSPMSQAVSAHYRRLLKSCLLLLAAGIFSVWIGLVVSPPYIGKRRLTSGPVCNIPTDATIMTAALAGSPPSSESPALSRTMADSIISQPASSNIPGFGQLVSTLLAPAKRTEVGSIVPTVLFGDSIKKHGPVSVRSNAQHCAQEDSVTFGSRGNTLVLPQDFFGSDGRLLPVTRSVSRRQHKINSSTLRSENGALEIEVPAHELHGVIDVVLTTLPDNRRFCIRIDLRNSVVEAVVPMLGKPLSDKGNHARPDDIRMLLIRMRKPNWTDDGLWARVKASVVVPVQVAGEAMEKSLVQQIRACSNNEEACVTRKLLDYRGVVQDAGSSASRRAKLLVDQTTSKLQNVYSQVLSTVPRLRSVSTEMPDLTNTMKKAQSRAKDIVAMKFMDWVRG